MILIAAGTEYGFDRLFRAMDSFVASGEIDDRMIGQIGSGCYVPRRFESFRFLPYDEYAEMLASAAVLVSHVGMGSILQACDVGIPSVVLPRKHSLGECVNDHQHESAKHVEQEGLAIVAWDAAELPACIWRARSFRPVCRSGDTRLIEAIRRDLLAVTRGWPPGRRRR